MEDVVIEMLAVTIVIVVVEMQLPPCQARQEMRGGQLVWHQTVFTEVEMLHSNPSTHQLAGQFEGLKVKRLEG